MTETDLTIPMKFDNTNFFILYPNPTLSAEVLGSIT